MTVSTASWRQQRVGVLSGGWGKLAQEREHTRAYAETVLLLLDQIGCRASLVECNDYDDLRKVTPNSVLFNCLYGRFGEDGGLAALLELLNISYTGSGPLASSLAMDKDACLRVLSTFGICVPKTVTIQHSTDIGNAPEDIYALLCDSDAATSDTPLVVKPNRSAFSRGVTVVTSASELSDAVVSARRFDNQVIVQRFIEGSTVHVPVLCGKSLQPVEAVPYLVERLRSQFDMRSSRKTYLIPTQLGKDVESSMQDIAELAYRSLDCRGLIRCDFQVSEHGAPYLLEVNVQHSIRQECMAVQSGLAAGIQPSQLVERILDDRWSPGAM